MRKLRILRAEGQTQTVFGENLHFSLQAEAGAATPAGDAW